MGPSEVLLVGVSHYNIGMSSSYDEDSGVWVLTSMEGAAHQALGPPTMSCSPLVVEEQLIIDMPTLNRGAGEQLASRCGRRQRSHNTIQS